MYALLHILALNGQSLKVPVKNQCLQSEALTCFNLHPLSLETEQMVKEMETDQSSNPDVASVIKLKWSHTVSQKKT